MKSFSFDDFPEAKVELPGRPIEGDLFRGGPMRVGRVKAIPFDSIVDAIADGYVSRGSNLAVTGVDENREYVWLMELAPPEGMPEAVNAIPAEGHGIFSKPVRPGFQMVGIASNGQMFQYKIVPDEDVKKTMQELVNLLGSTLERLKGRIN